MERKLRFEYLPISKIEISGLNVRKSNVEEDIDELAASIKAIGIQQPVVVFHRREREIYELIIGQRRFLACKKLGLKDIPAIIASVDNRTDAIIRSFSENIHRLKLDYRDKMNVATNLFSHFGSFRQVADALGVSEATVRNYLGYAGVPEELKRMVSEGKISAGTATEISKNISDEKEAIEIAQKVIEAPRGEPKRRIIETAKENPTKNAAEIVRLAERQKFKKITIHLTSRVSKALDEACRDFSSTPDDIARGALEEWLTSQGFL